MADDDKKEDSTPDPWADILAGDAGEPQPELAFSFDEAPVSEPSSGIDALVPAEPEADKPETSAPIDAVPAAEGAPNAALDDDLVGSWLDEPAAAQAELAGDAIPQELPGESSAIQIGTGASGIVAAEELDVWAEASPGSDIPSAEADVPSDAFAFTASAEPEAGAGDADESFPFVSAAGDESSASTSGQSLDDAPAEAAVLAGAAAGAVASAPRKAAKSAKQKKGGLGQMIGLVLGGVMAIPIVCGILVGLMWAGVNVPVGRSIGRALPESVAFIVPEKFRPGFKKAAATAALPKAASLDDLGTSGSSADEPPMDETSSSVGDSTDLAVDETKPAPEGEPTVDDVAVVPPADGETFEDPLAAAAGATQTATTPAPLDAAAQAAATAAAAAAAAAADRQQLDAAVEAALTAVAAVEEVSDAEDPARKALLVDLYKSLAKVGEELVMLEHMSADAGRPLAEPPQSIVDIHDRLGRHRDELVRLGRNWLDYSKRSSNGVVLPVTFEQSRRIGPYWSSKMALALPKGATREITVLSRAEPAAVQGDAVILTGIVFDGDVVWAADVRPLVPPGGGFSNPF